MKTIISIFLAAFISLAGATAHAQFVIGGGGWLQGAGASSSSNASTVGGSGAALAGIAGSTSSAMGINESAAVVTQTPGSTNVQTGSVSNATQTNLSGALGGALSFGGGASGASGNAVGGGLQGAGIIFGF